MCPGGWAMWPVHRSSLCRLALAPCGPRSKNLPAFGLTSSESPKEKGNDVFPPKMCLAALVAAAVCFEVCVARPEFSRVDPADHLAQDFSQCGKGVKCSCKRVTQMLPVQDLGETVLVYGECSFQLIKGPFPIFALININASWEPGLLTVLPRSVRASGFIFVALTVRRPAIGSVLALICGDELRQMTSALGIEKVIPA
ncbi:hypothetical protein MG293_019265 [Ovis ammon polii]|uniref:Uncharacterized protein n=1 Tax=Ovis ammon polii TaxID=230172 RepID=A0AAD4TNM8_OVIAM|nr:hypothetical protein MG293_019265 [Ovis ammon polii]